MNLKKKMKGFFTLTRKANGGFTLVELIVVIAILAILAGVAVPAYSGYITQTNKQADVTLAKDIEHALILGYYDGTVEPGAYVIVTPDSDVDVSEGDGAAEAMTAVFGNYSGLRLKYNEWDNSVAGVVADYSGSSFAGNEKALLEDVQSLTDAFGAFIEGNDDDIQEVAGEAFNEFLEDNDIDPTDKQQVANALALYAAQRTGGMTEAEKTKFIEAWNDHNAANTMKNFLNLKVNGKSLGTAGSLAAIYARGEAIVNYVEAQTSAWDAKHGVTTDTTITGRDGKTYPNVTAWFRAQDISGTDTATVKAKIDALNDETTYQLMNTNYKQFTPQYFAGTAEQDAKAYLSVLGAIEDSTPALLKEIDSGNMYGSGKVETFLNSYISAGEVFADLNVESNAVIVILQSDGTAITIPLYNLGLMG